MKPTWFPPANDPDAPSALRGREGRPTETALRDGFRSLRAEAIPPGEVGEMRALLGLREETPAGTSADSSTHWGWPAPWRAASPTGGRVNVVSRRAFLRVAAPLAVALALGSAAGVWVSGRNPPPDPNETLSLYQQADHAYDRFKPEQATALVRQAVRGKLRVPSLVALLLDNKYRPVMGVQDGITKYALALAEDGKIDEALDVNRLLLRMGDQMLEDPRYHGTEATIMYKTELVNRKRVYLAAGDRANAERADKEFKRKLALDIKLTGKMDSDLLNNRSLYLTWGKGDRKVAQMEAELRRRIKQAWRSE